MEHQPSRPVAVLEGPADAPAITLRFDRSAIHPATGEPLVDWVKRLPGRSFDPAARIWTVTETGPDADRELGAAGFLLIGPDDLETSADDWGPPLVRAAEIAGSHEPMAAIYPRLQGRAAATRALPAGAIWRESENRWVAPARAAASIAGAVMDLRVLASQQLQPSVLEEPAPSLSLVPAIGGEFGPDLDYDGTLSGLLRVPMSELGTVGARGARQFAEFSIDTVWDLVHHVPRRYIDRSNPVLITDELVGEKIAVIGVVTGSSVSQGGSGRMAMTSINVRTEDGTVLRCKWGNASWMSKRYREGMTVIVYGKLGSWTSPSGYTSFDMFGPLIDVMEDGGTAGMIPIYPQSAKADVDTWQLHRAAVEAIARMGALDDPIPQELLARRELTGRLDAFRLVHCPENPEHAAAGRRRLAYDELLRLQISLMMARAVENGVLGVPHRPTGGLTDQWIASLPFAMTGAQTRALGEIEADMRASSPMDRLLQGDVGAGKTLVALGSLLHAVESGCQGVLMAPTEILASQHFAEISERLAGVTKPSGAPVVVELLTNKVIGKKKKAVIAGLADGSIDIVVGTHSILAPAIVFAALSLVVIDEQHRFGVEQRALLRTKGPNGRTPDMLVATATPIPRTAVMTIFGDLSVSVLDEMPPGRTPIATYHVPTDDALPADASAATWRKVRAEVAEGRQAFVVCPLVTDSETKAAAAAESVAADLGAGALAGLRIAVVHGKQKAAERAPIMAAFVAGDIDVLVATTVIEVGVNVPNATVMVIMAAERFGIAQLHQLRGRVGRGRHAGTCLLVGTPKTADSVERLTALCRTTDGFELSEIDLRIRGFGTLLGGIQSGAAKDLRVADLFEDADLLAYAREDAMGLIAADPTLASSAGLLAELSNMLGDAAAWLISA